MDGQRVVYFQKDKLKDLRRQFKDVTQHTNPPNATSGGITMNGCAIGIPGGMEFHAVSFRGDVEGWNKDIQEGARFFKIILASIELDKIVLSDGESFLLSDCDIKFY